jgi:NADH-quinone oxidoreductase subunit L
VLELLGHDAGARTEVLRGYDWLSSGNLRVAFDLRLDPLSATMALIVTGVSTLIHLYSIGYMAADDRRATFFAWLNLFVASMLTLVLAQNFLVLFVGWEGVGLCSYLLIGFWFNRLDVPGFEGRGVPAAAKKAFIANRIGDFGFLIAMFLLVAKTGSLDFDQVFGRVSALAGGSATAVALLFFLACTGKSAQIPLYVWLPDAMAGPTPVSALIHAATMVTAGVYLVARTHVLFQASHAAQVVVVVIGACTALLAALIAIGQDDIKRILAYSTVSQLGYMFIGVGLGPIGYAAGIFHLVTHAFFKAQLFLGAGSVMHANNDDTDVKRFGGLRRAMPITFLTTAAAWLAIIAFPGTSGFFSKDEILAAAFHAPGFGGAARFAWVVGVLTAGVTGFYMSRLFFLTFLGAPRWPNGRHPHEAPAVMWLPLVVLGLLALAAGLLLAGGRALERFLEPVVGRAPDVASGGFGSSFALSTVATAAALLGALAAWPLYGTSKVERWMGLRVRFEPLWRLLANKFYVDEIYEFFTVTIGRAVAAFLAVTVEARGIDGTVNGLGELVGVAASRGRRVQSGLVRTYALGVLGGAVLIIAFLVFRTT